MEPKEKMRLQQRGAWEITSRSNMASSMGQQIQKRKLGTSEGNLNKTQISFIRIYLSYLILIMTNSLQQCQKGRLETAGWIFSHCETCVSLQKCGSEIPGHTEGRTIKFQQSPLFLQLQGILLNSSHSGEKYDSFKNAFWAPAVLQKSESQQGSSPRIARPHRTPLESPLQALFCTPFLPSCPLQQKCLRTSLLREGGFPSSAFGYLKERNSQQGRKTFSLPDLGRFGTRSSKLMYYAFFYFKLMGAVVQYEFHYKPSIYM